MPREFVGRCAARTNSTGLLPQSGSIDLDRYLEVRLEAYDGREPPEGAITIEPVD